MTRATITENDRYIKAETIRKIHFSRPFRTTLSLESLEREKRNLFEHEEGSILQRSNSIGKKTSNNDDYFSHFPLSIWPARFRSTFYAYSPIPMDRWPSNRVTKYLRISSRGEISGKTRFLAILPGNGIDVSSIHRDRRKLHFTVVRAQNANVASKIVINRNLEIGQARV